MANKIEDYDVVIDTSLDDLIKEVKELVLKGWTPLGGITVTI